MINPAFYENLVPLIADTHRNLKIDDAVVKFGFARNCTSVPVLQTEFAKAALTYPLVFLRKEGQPLQAVAMLGVCDTENLFVNTDNRWDADYIPLYLQHYPFNLMTGLQAEQLGIDDRCNALNFVRGELLIDAAGIEQQRVHEELQFFHDLQLELARTERTVTQLDELGLLVPLTDQLDTAECTVQLQDLYLIDEEKFAQIDHTALPALFESGALNLAYAHIASLNNMRYLLKRAARRVTEKPRAIRKMQALEAGFPRKLDADSQKPTLRLKAVETPVATAEQDIQRKQDVVKKLNEEMSRLAQEHKQRYAQDADETASTLTIDTPECPAVTKREIPQRTLITAAAVFAGIAIIWTFSVKKPGTPDIETKSTVVSTLPAGATAAPQALRGTDPFAGEMVQILPGKFRMGSTEGDSDEKPVRNVTISHAFELGKTEVTHKQWIDVMGRLPDNLSFKSCGDDCPVENISWKDAQQFISKLNTMSGKKYRLPNEAEWEYACRAGGTQTYCGSDNPDAVAWYGKAGRTPHPVATKEANAWGLYDMSGNVWEWVEDCYSKHYGESTSRCDARVLRGGSWSNDADTPRSANRYKRQDSERFNNAGFRLAKEL